MVLPKTGTETEGRYTLMIGKINRRTPHLQKGHEFAVKTMSWTTLAEAEQRKGQLEAVYPDYQFFTCVNPCGVRED